MGNSKPSPESPPLALLNPAPTLGEQPSADEAATIEELAGTHARLEETEVRYAFHAGYLAALHSMRDTVTTGATPAVRPGTVLTDAEREEVARVVESVLQRRRAAETPNHPAAAPDWLRSRPHIGAYHCVPLHTMDYVPDGVSHTWRPREIMTALTQGYREIEPRVLLTDSTDTVELRLSLGEARQLRDHLDELLADADGDLPSTGEAGPLARVALVPAAAVEALLKVGAEANTCTKVQRQTAPKTADQILASDLATLPRLPDDLVAVERDLVAYRVKRGTATPQDTTYLAALREEITRRQTTPTP